VKLLRRPPTALLLAAPLLVGLSLLEPLAQQGEPPRPSRLLTSSPAEILPQLDVAAAAVRAGDFVTARRTLEPLILGLDAPTALEARVLLGLYAHATGDWTAAYERLDDTGAYDGRFADWRLWALAESAEQLGLVPGAQQAWSRLLSDHPTSPLRFAALERAVGLAAAGGDVPRTLDLLATARGEAPSRDRLAPLEERLWNLTDGARDSELRRELARHLLVEHPLEASRLRVVEVLREPEGRVAWSSLFSSDELERRARHLLDAGIQQGAIESLETGPELARGEGWHLLAAEALIDAQRGLEALSRLERRATADPALEMRREWLLARAAIDASKSRRGRVNLPINQRQAMASRARDHLWRIVDSEAGAEFAPRALRLLVAELDEDGDLQEARRTLAALRSAEPEDTQGAAFLWRLGWREYERRQFDAAVALWNELATHYPVSSYARSGLYWSARAHQQRGNDRLAQELYRQTTAVSVDDFYRRHALHRLDGASGEPRRQVADLSWPSDPLLDRARLLSDLGLDSHALIEIAGLGRAPDRRAGKALEAIVLARQGRRRDSIQALWQVFPVLGTVHQEAAPADALRLYYPLDFREVIEQSARSQGVEPTVIQAMIRQESAFDTRARSHAGARGLMQVMPETGRELARKLGLPFHAGRLEEPDFSVQLGTAYYREVLSLFDGNQELALAGYNGGPYRIRRWWRQAAGRVEVDQFVEGLELSETRSYVKRVLLIADSYRRLYG